MSIGCLLEVITCSLTRLEDNGKYVDAVYIAGNIVTSLV
jgi:hypothetical protein